MKQHTGKKLLALALTLLMLLSSVPFAFAETGLDIGGRCGKNLYWTLDDQGKLTITGTGEMLFYYEDDDTYEGYDNWYDYHRDIKTVEIQPGATSIAPYAFEDCYYLESVSIPSTVQKIGEYAFGWCHALTDITIPNGVTTIEDGTFYDCNELERIVLPSSVTSIGERAFYGCNNLAEAPITESIETIGEGAFSFCENIESIFIPASVKSIGGGVFNTGSLTDITVDPNNQNFVSVDNVLFDKAQTRLLQYPTASEATTYTTPDATKVIDNFAFLNAYKLETVTLTNVTEIGKSAFNAAYSLQTVTMNQVEYIDEGAFGNCNELQTVVVSDSLKVIGDEAFASCDFLEQFHIPAGVENIGYSAFLHCAGLKAISVSPANANYESDENGVLYSKGKETLIQYPIGNEQTSFTIPAPVERIEDYAFSEADRLSSVTMQNNVKEIGESAFGWCVALERVTLSGSLQTIGIRAFIDCNSLRQIAIPENVTEIESRAFESCYSLEQITVAADNQKYTSIDGVLFTKSGSKLVQYPLGNERTTYTVPEQVKRIGAYAFAEANNLQKIILPESLTVIGDDAFHECQALQEIRIPPFVTEIPYEAFEYCNSLRTVYIPYSVKRIFSWAFNCEEIDDVYYAGSQEEWNNINIYGNDGALSEANIHFCDHAATTAMPAVPATCSVPGYTAGVQCDFCGRWLKGHKKGYVAHTDDNNDGVCDICANLTSDLYVGETTTITLTGNQMKELRFIPLEDGYYDVSLFYDYETADVDCYAEDEDGYWVDKMSAGEIYYFNFKNWEAEDDGVISVDVTVRKQLQGDCGNDFSWAIYDNYYVDGIAYKLLSIYGSGDMWDYSEEPAPWADVEGINAVEIYGDEIGEISMDAFSTITDLDVLLNEDYTNILSERFLTMFDGFTVYCYNGSAEHRYCKANGISVVLLDEETEFLEDEDTGVAVSYYEGAFDEADVSLKVEEQETNNENARSWDIKPVDESGALVQPNGPVQIWLPLPENWNGKHLLVTHKHEDGTVEYITNYSINGDYVVFWVSEFSVFTVTAQDYPVHEHEFELVEVIDPTCKEEGERRYACSVCGEEKTTEIPVVDHEDANNDGKCDMCGNQMVGGDHCPRCGKIHNNGFFDRIVGFFHRIFYRLTHLFG